MKAIATLFIAAAILTAATGSTGSVHESKAPSRDSTAGAGTCGQSGVGGVALGMTLTHLSVAPDADALCSAGGSVASLAGQDNILLRYSDPQARQRANGYLRTMAARGASTLRDVVWFRHAEDNAAARAAAGRDALGLAVATDGRFPTGYIENIVALASDAKAAGFRRAIFVIGPQGAANPKCRQNKQWGACYDDRFEERSWSVVRQVAEALRTPALAGIDLILDIAPEMCFVRNSAQDVDRKFERYATHMLTRYRDAFRDDRFIMSCGGGSGPRNERMLRDTSALFDELGVRPAFLDIHLYLTEPRWLVPTLVAADGTARRLHIPLVVGETFVDHVELFQTIARLKGDGQLTSLAGIVVWPLRVGSTCAIGVPPPYDLGEIERAFGRLGNSGDGVRACRN